MIDFGKITRNLSLCKGGQIPDYFPLLLRQAGWVAPNRLAVHSVALPTGEVRVLTEQEKMKP